MCLVPLLRTGSQTCTNSHLCHSNGCLIPENTLTTTVHMQIMPSLAHTICIKSLWKDAYVSLPTAYFMPVYFWRLWRSNKTILCKGMLLSNSPYAVTDRIVDLVGQICLCSLQWWTTPSHSHSVFTGFSVTSLMLGEGFWGRS